jgi:hypothetical protein
MGEAVTLNWQFRTHPDFPAQAPQIQQLTEDAGNGVRVTCERL